jgi:hypothetical protein
VLANLAVQAQWNLARYVTGSGLEGGVGVVGWLEVGKNVAEVGVIVLPFAVVGTLSRGNIVSVANA